MIADGDLLRAGRDGDNDSGNEIVRRHMRVLYRLFRNKVDRDVDELIQRTWLACLETKSPYRGNSSFVTWLLGVGRYVLPEFFRRGRRDAEGLDFGSISPVALGTSPTQGLARKDEHRLLLQALRSIPLDHQIALELFHWEELTNAQLVEVLGVPHNTMRTRINRDRKALRERIEQLAESADVLESSHANLDDWAKSLREYLAEDRKAS